MPNERYDQKLVLKDLHAPNEEFTQRMKGTIETCNIGKAIFPKRRRHVGGKMCNQKRAEERLWPPESKDIIRRLFAL